MPVSPDQLKRIIGPLLRPYWSSTRPTYFGFLDTSYELVPATAWSSLIAASPTVAPNAYIANIFDCDDMAYEFKVFASKRQVTHFPASATAFAIGIAVGYFDWVGAGRELHAANFGVIEDGTGRREIEWFDLRTRQAYPFNRVRTGLEWVLV